MADEGFNEERFNVEKDNAKPILSMSEIRPVVELFKKQYGEELGLVIITNLVAMLLYCDLTYEDDAFKHFIHLFTQKINDEKEPVGNDMMLVITDLLLNWSGLLKGLIFTDVGKCKSAECAAASDDLKSSQQNSYKNALSCTALYLQNRNILTQDTFGTLLDNVRQMLIFRVWMPPTLLTQSAHDGKFGFMSLARTAAANNALIPFRLANQLKDLPNVRIIVEKCSQPPNDIFSSGNLKPSSGSSVSSASQPMKEQGKITLMVKDEQVHKLLGEEIRRHNQIIFAQNRLILTARDDAVSECRDALNHLKTLSKNNLEYAKKDKTAAQAAATRAKESFEKVKISANAIIAVCTVLYNDDVVVINRNRTDKTTGEADAAIQASLQAKQTCEQKVRDEVAFLESMVGEAQKYATTAQTAFSDATEKLSHQVKTAAEDKRLKDQQKAAEAKAAAAAADNGDAVPEQAVDVPFQGVVPDQAVDVPCQTVVPEPAPPVSVQDPVQAVVSIQAAPVLVKAGDTQIIKKDIKVALKKCKEAADKASVALSVNDAITASLEAEQACALVRTKTVEYINMMNARALASPNVTFKKDAKIAIDATEKDVIDADAAAAKAKAAADAAAACPLPVQNVQTQPVTLESRAMVAGIDMVEFKNLFTCELATMFEIATKIQELPDESIFALFASKRELSKYMRFNPIFTRTFLAVGMLQNYLIKERHTILVGGKTALQLTAVLNDNMIMRVNTLYPPLQVMYEDFEPGICVSRPCSDFDIFLVSDDVATLSLQKTFVGVFLLFFSKWGTTIHNFESHIVPPANYDRFLATNKLFLASRSHGSPDTISVKTNVIGSILDVLDVKFKTHKEINTIFLDLKPVSCRIDITPSSMMPGSMMPGSIPVSVLLFKLPNLSSFLNECIQIIIKELTKLLTHKRIPDNEIYFFVITTLLKFF